MWVVGKATVMSGDLPGSSADTPRFSKTPPSVHTTLSRYPRPPLLKSNVSISGGSSIGKAADEATALATIGARPAISPYRHPPDRREPKRNAVPVRRSQALITTSRSDLPTSAIVLLPKSSLPNARSNAVVRLPQVGRLRSRSCSSISASSSRSLSPCGVICGARPQSRRDRNSRSRRGA